MFGFDLSWLEEEEGESNDLSAFCNEIFGESVLLSEKPHHPKVNKRKAQDNVQNHDSNEIIADRPKRTYKKKGIVDY